MKNYNLHTVVVYLLAGLALMMSVPNLLGSISTTTTTTTTLRLAGGGVSSIRGWNATATLTTTTATNVGGTTTTISTTGAVPAQATTAGTTTAAVSGHGDGDGGGGLVGNQHQQTQQTQRSPSATASCPTAGGYFTWLSDRGGDYTAATTTTKTTTATVDAAAKPPGRSRRRGNNNSHYRIPPVLYQTSKDRCVTTDLYRASIARWFPQQLPPTPTHTSPSPSSSQQQQQRSPPRPSASSSLSYRFYDDDAMDAYLNDMDGQLGWSETFPTLSMALRCIDHLQNMPVMKADLWRYLILWDKGGIYADLDVLPHPDLVDLLLVQQQQQQQQQQQGGGNVDEHDDDHHDDHDDGNDDALFVLVDMDGQRVLSQWFLAAAPHHPLFRYAVEEAASRVLKAKRAIPIQHTGPRALYVATDRFLASNTPKPTATTASSTPSPDKVVAAAAEVVHARDLRAGKTYHHHGGGGNGCNTGDADENENGDPCRRRRSFRVLPPAMARNNAVREEKDAAYMLMNMTHYTGHQKQGKRYGGRTCLEFLGGTYLVSREAGGEDPKRATSFEYMGRIYNFTSE
jgi:Glycosyltransferase sugar-binding region containing DXD motif